MFGMMLTQRPLNMKARRGLHMTFIMTPDELKSLSREMHKLQSRHEEFQERADDLVRSLPKSLYLIFRYVSFKEVQQVELGGWALVFEVGYHPRKKKKKNTHTQN